MTLVKRIRRKPGGIRASDQCQFPIPKLMALNPYRQKRFQRAAPLFDIYKCQRVCGFEVDGVRCCKPHVGQVLLKMALKGKLVMK